MVALLWGHKSNADEIFIPYLITTSVPESTYIDVIINISEPFGDKMY